MANDIITVLRKAPGEPWEVDTVVNELHALQKAVGGYIEVVTLVPGVVVICDEEGRLYDRPFNCEIAGIGFVGTILIAGVDGEEFCDVPDDVIGAFVGETGDYFEI